MTDQVARREMRDKSVKKYPQRTSVVALPEKNNDRRITLSMINLTRYGVSTKGTVRGNALMDLSPPTTTEKRTNWPHISQ